MKDSKYWRNELANDPGNFFLQKMVRMVDNAENSGRFERLEPQRIEATNPEAAGRGGECDVALEILLDIYPTGQPYRLTSDGTDFPHTFLMYKGVPLDICGTTSLDEMQAHYNNDSLRAEPVTLTEVQTYFRGHRTPTEKRSFETHLRNHILSNIGRKFPHPEPQRKAEERILP